MSLKIAENDLVELTWWDEFDSKEYTEISVHTECDDGSGDVWLDVGGLTLSLQAWGALINRLNPILEGGLQKFINEYKVIGGDVEVISNNKIRIVKHKD